MSELHLQLHCEEPVMEPIRKGIGRGLKAAGERDARVVALCADLTESTQMHLFAEAFPERFVEVGIAEQNLVTVASGLASQGKIPFCSSYAAFSPGRNWEQIRTTICLNDQPVRILGSHAGLYTGPDGGTHQMLEDYAIMRALPNMTVFAPCDSLEAERVIAALVIDARPAYIRITREATPVITSPHTPFEIGKAYVYRAGRDITFVSTGVMTLQALQAADMLTKDGIEVEVVHVPTIKPLDGVTILRSAERTRAVITLEEHQIHGGLGSAVAELLSENLPTPLRRLGVRDKFGESGKPAELLDYFGLSATHAAMAAHEL